MNYDTLPFETMNNSFVGKETNGDFTTAYTSATTLTLSSLPTGVTAITARDIIAIVVYDGDDQVKGLYNHRDHNISVTTNVVTIAGASLLSTDSFTVYTNIPTTIT